MISGIKQVNYSIGWFRLHEAILKNEHERAFLNYKLLMHSFTNKGYQMQIQGELHLLFSETELALKYFYESFLFYFYSKDYIPALLLYFKIKELKTDIIPEFIQLKEIINNQKKKYILFEF